MKFDTFIDRVHTRTGLTPADSIDATRATLQSVAERIGLEESRRLATQLPRELARYLQEKTPAGAEHLSFGDFCQRVAIREESNVPDAIAHARCVIETVEEAVEPGRSRNVFLTLHRDFAALFY